MEEREQNRRIGVIKAAVPRMRAICAPGGKRDREEREFALYLGDTLDKITDWLWWTPSMRDLYHETLRVTYNAAKERAESKAESEIRERLAEMRSRIRERPHKSKKSAFEYIRYLTRSTSRTRKIWSLESRVSDLMVGLATIWSQLDQDTIEKSIKTLAKAKIRINKTRI